MSKRETQKEKEEAISRLREILKPGDTVFGIVRSVSRSGMSRTIDFYAFKAAGPDEPGRKHCGEVDRFYLSGYIATALDYRRDKWGALKVQGCGMDMVHHVAYGISRHLFPEGFGVPCEKCRNRPRDIGQAARHRASRSASCSDSGPCEFRGRNGSISGWDEDGGYALKAETL